MPIGGLTPTAMGMKMPRAIVMQPEEIVGPAPTAEMERAAMAAEIVDM